MHYYQFNIGDYVSHTSHLTDAEDLTYRRMLDLYYQTETSFDEINKEKIARKVRSTVEIVEVILSEFFEYSNDTCSWHNKRADSEIKKYHSKSDSARKANQIRWGSDKDLKSDAVQILNNKQETINNKHIKHFDAFWSAYPRKTAKGNAESAWKKIKPDEQLLEEILTAVAKQKSTWTDPKFIPHPATWLNGKRWLDGVDTTAGKKLKYWEKGYQP